MKNAAVAIATIIPMTVLIDRDPVVDHDLIQEDIQDRIPEIVILKKEGDIDPKHHIRDHDLVRENDRHDHVINRIVIVVAVIPGVEPEVRCVGELHQEEVVLKVRGEAHHEKYQDVPEVVALNKIVGG